MLPNPFSSDLAHQHRDAIVGATTRRRLTASFRRQPDQPARAPSAQRARVHLGLGSARCATC
jgi:hypothetical protein